VSGSRNRDLRKNGSTSTPAPEDFEKDQELASLKEKASLAEEAPETFPESRQHNAPQANARELQAFVMMKRDFALVLPFNDAALAVLHYHLFSGLFCL